MTITQLAFDALPEWRARDGLWPIEAHQRGWVRLPERLVPHFGDSTGYAPGWVCCRCGGVELNHHILCLNHGCCYWPWQKLYDRPRRQCFHQEAIDRDRSRGRSLPEPGPFWALWTPERAAA